MSENNWPVREASESDLPAIAEFFKCHERRPSKQEWLEWKYLQNPDGPARIFIVEGPDGEIISVAAYLPRLFHDALGKIFTAMQNTDLLVAPEFRRRGVNSARRDFTASKMTAARLAFPNQLAARIPHKSPQRWASAYLDRWWFPAALGQSVADGRPNGFIRPLLDIFSRAYARAWLGASPQDMHMRPVRRFERDFGMDPHVTHGIRSADFLNWRFIDNKMNTYECYEFVEGEETIGYCVYRIFRSKAEIFDLVTDRRQKGCLRLLVDHCRDSGIIHLRFRCIGLCLWNLGFVRRRDPKDQCRLRDFPAGPCVITLADRDY